jgi:hypothetical protein
VVRHSAGLHSATFDRRDPDEPLAEIEAMITRLHGFRDRQRDTRKL